MDCVVACGIFTILIVALAWAIRHIDSKKREQELTKMPDMWTVEEAPSGSYGYAYLSEADLPLIRKMIREEIAKSKE